MPELPINETFSEKMYQEEHNSKQLIVKGNQIVQHAHFSMPLADQKVLASLIRSIKPGQKDLTVRFSTHQYMKMLGMRKSGTTFASIMNTLHHIANDNFFIRRPDGKYQIWFWLDKVVADPHAKGNGDFLVKFRPELRDYLFNAALRYKTIYRFSDIMLMQSRYSPRLYEIFRSNQSRQKVQKRGLNYSIKELKIGLNLMHRDKRTNKIKHDKQGNIKFMYPRFNNFNNRVLRPACHEINLLTEYNIKMHRLYHGRKVIGINVVMSYKNKNQRLKRSDIIYCITHHIPRSQWSSWRKNAINGKFHKVNSKNKHKNRRHPQQLSLEDELKKYKIPLREINMSGDKIEYYSPFAKKYIWTSRKEHDEQTELYQKQKNIIKKYRNR